MASTSSLFPNSSLSLLPSSFDLLMTFPRLGYSIADFFGFGDSTPLNNTSGNDTAETFAAVSGLMNEALKQDGGDLSGTAGSTSAGWYSAFLSAVQRVGNFDGIFSYLISRWASTTIVVAVILNRAHAFASTREPIRQTWKSRLLLRIVPLLLLIQQALVILQTLRCQTGFRLPEIRYKGSETTINKSWVSSPGYLNRTVSTILFWQTTEESCIASGMIAAGDDSMDFHGSAAVLWPLFIVLSLSQLSETVSSALRGRQPRPETGMSIFEHSMAFAEAETVARTSVGIGFFGLPQPPTATANATESAGSPSSSANASGTLRTFTRAMILQKLNIAPEMLLITLISCCSHLSSQILAIAGLQRQFRLINTSVWGIMFLSLFFHSLITYAWASNLEDIYLARYPTVCILGFIPHILTVLGALVCMLVYVFAIFSALLSPPRQWKGLSTYKKMKLAHANMSASASWTKINVSMQDDFYHFLLRVGYQIMMAAAEAVYFNEGVRVTLSPETWLEKARYDEAMKAGRTRTNVIPLELHQEFAEGDGFGLVDESPQLGPDRMPLPSGYARERKTMKHLNKSNSAAIKEEGVGLSQRSGRWYMSWKLLEKVAELLQYCTARLALSCWEALRRDRQPPTWLLRAAYVRESILKDKVESTSQKNTLESWRLTEFGGTQIVNEDDSKVDAEKEIRHRLGTQSSNGMAGLEESEVDSHLYDWWKRGGWWGEVDESADYEPHSDDFDTTSIISGSGSGWETESNSSNASDATEVPRRYVRSSSIENEDQERLNRMANLLEPKSLEEKHEARLLAHRLRDNENSNRPMTRSQYTRSVLQDRLSVLPGSSQSPLLNPDDEALMLQHLIVSRRRAAPKSTGVAKGKKGQSWHQGGAGMGTGGPQCTVCHSAPRTVLVWPCRCLSLCEECRVTLAESNFATCVCCRRDVVAFSRLFVP